MTFAEHAGLERRHKETKRERFLREMDQVVPWQRLVALIEPYYPKCALSAPRMTYCGAVQLGQGAAAGKPCRRNGDGGT